MLLAFCVFYQAPDTPKLFSRGSIENEMANYKPGTAKTQLKIEQKTNRYGHHGNLCRGFYSAAVQEMVAQKVFSPHNQGTHDSSLPPLGVFIVVPVLVSRGSIPDLHVASFDDHRVGGSQARDEFPVV